MPGIDYSKWDSMEVSSSSASESESDDEKAEIAQRVQQAAANSSQGCSDALSNSSIGGTVHRVQHEPSVEVVRLTYPSRVVVGPDGVRTERGRPPAEATASPFRAPPPSPSSSQTTGRESDRDDGAAYAKLTRNGGREGDSHLWSQTRDTLTISFLVPPVTKASDISGLRVWRSAVTSPSSAPPQDSHPDAPLPRCHISFSNACEATLNARTFTFCYPVVVSQGEGVPGEAFVEGGEDPAVEEEEQQGTRDAFDESCWELLSLPSLGLRLLVVQLVKEPVGAGVYHWWDRLFTTDVSAAARPVPAAASERDPLSVGDAADPARAPRKSASEVWREAHESFRQRVRERKQQSA